MGIFDSFGKKKPEALRLNPSEALTHGGLGVSTPSRENSERQ